MGSLAEEFNFISLEKCSDERFATGSDGVISIQNSIFQTLRCDGKTQAGRTVYRYGNNDNC